MGRMAYNVMLAIHFDYTALCPPYFNLSTIRMMPQDTCADTCVYQYEVRLMLLAKFMGVGDVARLHYCLCV